MRTVEQLVESRYDKSLGNHRVYFVNGDTERHFVYFSTTICKVDDTKLQFTVANGGYYTSSTKRAISAYRREFYSLGYTEIVELTVTKQKRNGTFEAEDQIGSTWFLDPNQFPDRPLEKGLKVVAHVVDGDIEEIRFIVHDIKEVQA